MIRLHELRERRLLTLIASSPTKYILGKQTIQNDNNTALKRAHTPILLHNSI